MAASVVEKTHGDISWKCLPEAQLTLGSPIEDFQKHLLPFVGPEWKDRQLGYKTFDNGITNALYAIYDSEKGLKGSGEDVILLRVNGNGTGELIDRTDELVSLITLSRNNLCAPLYVQLSNGLCYGFKPGRSLTPKDFSDPKLMKLNARALAKLHCVQIPSAFEGRDPLVWYKCDKWMKIVPHKFDDPVKEKCFQQGIGSIDTLQRELDEMKTVLAKCDSPIAFCHNDLLCGNFIYNEGKEDMSMVDFEYAGPNYLAYDIGNHFCEFAGIDNVDYNLYPSEALQREWLRSYLEETAKIKGNDTAVSDEAITSLYRQVNKFALASHLFWTVWALIQSLYSVIDFNYIEYAGTRFAEYKRRKQAFLSL